MSATGRLTITVLNAQRRPLENARVRLTVGRSAVTGHDGVVSFDALPGKVGIEITHRLCETSSGPSYLVAQQGETRLEFVLQTALPRPTVALMPVEILPGSVSADRREMQLRVRLVSSSKGGLDFRFDGWGGALLYVGLSFDSSRSVTQRDCNLIYDSWEDPAFVCSPWGDPVNFVTATAFDFSSDVRAPLQTEPGAAPATMLLVDQSQRMAQFMDAAERSLALRHLSDVLVRDAASPRPLAIAGFAGSGAGSAPMLPSLPVWLPRGAGAGFANDAAILQTDLSVLEPLTGGNSPVLDAIESAVATTAGGTVAGGRTVVAVVSGDDQSGLSVPQRAAKLAALRQQRLDTGVQTILIAAFDPNDVTGSVALSDLAESLGAPYISTGLVDLRHDVTTTGDGLFAALDLAADLLAGGTIPTLSFTVRVRAPVAGAYAPGSTVRGVIFLESDICPVGCQELALPFAVRVP